jgi:hypothetical protein
VALSEPTSDCSHYNNTKRRLEGYLKYNYQLQRPPLAATSTAIAAIAAKIFVFMFKFTSFAQLT